jgi:ferredoxin--NADP+ reductase
VDVTLDQEAAAAVRASDAKDPTGVAKRALLTELAGRSTGSSPTIRLAFFRTPQSIETDAAGVVSGVTFGVNRFDSVRGGIEATGESETVNAGLVLTSIGYRGVEVPGLPFDHTRGIIPNDRGRVVTVDGPVPGLYVTGWIKRGPSGFIGTNKSDSAETVAQIRADVEAGRLAGPARTRRRLLSH